jgi:NitT/TauT family transport system substrate-binding protein
MFKKFVLLTLGLAIGLMACSLPKVRNEAGDLVHVKLPLGYIPNVQFAPLYVAVEKGFFAEAGIEIEFDYSYETDALALVGADELQFAVVSGEQILLARARGLPVVYVAAWYQQYPVAVVSKVEQGLVTPADLKGKRIGLPVFGGANYIGLDALLFSAGLTESDVSLEPIGFTQVESLATDRVQAVSVYAANEPVQLRAQGYEINEILVADYVRLASNGLIPNEKTIAENPDLVQRMVSVLVRALEYALANPGEAYELSKAHVENLAAADQAVQKEVLARSMELWKAERLGFSDMQAWENMQETLLKMGMLGGPLDLNAAFTNEFVP